MKEVEKKWEELKPLIIYKTKVYGEEPKSRLDKDIEKNDDQLGFKF